MLWTIFQVFLTFIVLVASFTGPTSASVFKVINSLFLNKIIIIAEVVTPLLLSKFSITTFLGVKEMYVLVVFPPSTYHNILCDAIDDML